ncbi:uncharacterized protein [Dysidea avara]|uniref:uncharacterized protein n=1 Tax=Dysidea avara TaxID=196820 RepID=UPI00331F7C0C
MVLWLSLILRFFLLFKLLVPIYATIYKYQKEAFSYVWAVFFTGVVIFILLVEDIDSNLLNLDSSSSNDYKEVITDVYVFGLLAAMWFPKHIRFPVPVLTELFDILNSGMFAVLTFIIQTLCIWLMIQLLTVPTMFFLVTVLAKPVVVMVSVAYMLTFVALTISGTSVMLEVISLWRLSPCRVVLSRNSYKRDMFNFITSLLLPIFIVVVLLVTYEFSDKLGSTLDITGVPAAIVGIVQAVVLFVLSVTIRKKKFRQIFDEVEDESRHKFLYDDNHNTLSEDYSSTNDS